ncbi:ImmA/IrrE family metallo-endopeptidase [Lentzea sp. NPDC005914]|uniref:ImmA/IrrE family metallo-endopeptidase n=1 Tax=Lentzea sp. NPDC005914 TaxID=3154572 RepID=UPI0033FBE163
MSTPPFVARRRRALQAAAELLDNLGVDQEQPIDVFDAIAQLGVWLVFRPLKTLLGVVIPEGDSGIMITTERTPTIQRYTAAHEIGHLVLDHNKPAFDTNDDIMNPEADERERLAQWFASYLLMPPPLVHVMASRYGVRRSAAVTPAQVYLMARDMRVSYEAALRQAANLNIIGDDQRDALMQVPLLRIKTELAHGHRPKVGNADVWPINEDSMHHQIDVVLDDEIIIDLPENRTSGHRWLDISSNTRRATLQRKPAPPAFALPTATPVPAEPSSEAPRRTGADITAALALLPDARKKAASEDHADEGEAANEQDAMNSTKIAQSDHEGLVVVSDDYQPGWAKVIPRGAAALRRRNAGAEISPTAFLPSDTVSADQRAPGAGATGRRWLAVRAQDEGNFTFILHYAATHDPRTPPAATYTIVANVQPPPVVLNRRKLIDIELDDDQTGPMPDAGDENRL